MRKKIGGFFRREKPVINFSIKKDLDDLKQKEKKLFFRKPSTRPSFIGKSAAITANAIRAARGNLLPEMFHHEHEGENRKMFQCYDSLCEAWIWSDPKIQNHIPLKFHELVNKKRDFRILQLALLCQIHEDLDLILGPVRRIPGTNRRIKLKPLIATVITLISVYGLGAITKGPVLDLLLVIF